MSMSMSMCIMSITMIITMSMGSYRCNIVTGLKLIAIENGMNVPDLHMDPTYSKAFHFNLSTSQVMLVCGDQAMLSVEIRQCLFVEIW